MSDNDQVRRILTADDRLDDITRARMWARIEDRIEAPATPRRSGRRTAIVLGAVAAAATVLLVMRTFRAHDDRDVTVAAGAMLTSRLGPHARAALVGPARLELLGPPGDVTAARLHDGTLLAELEGGAGRSLRIEAADLTVEIIGTLFAIEVHDVHACVAVAHGTVRVTSHGASQLVTDGQQLCSGELAPHAIPPDVADQLARHERSIAVAMAPVVGPHPEADPVPPVVTSPVDAAPWTAIAVAPSPPPVDRAAPVRSAPVTRASPAPSPARPPNVVPAPQRVVATESTRAPEVVPREPSAPPVKASEAAAPPVKASELIAPEPAKAPPDPAPPAVAPPPSAEALYHAAEVALAAGDRVAADRALAKILAMPSSPLIDQALYERARIAYQNRAFPAARRFLATLATLPSTPLAEPGRYLDCRIAVQAREGDAERCFLAYRTAYPRSPHDLDVLAVLAQLAHARGGCTAARAVRDELIARYPRTDHAAAWRSRCVEAP